MPAAVWAGLTARKLYTIERRREDDRDVAEESRQTELVASWVSWTDQPRIAMHLPDGRTSRANLAIQNGSAVPVYDVQVMYIEGREPLGRQRFHVLSPTGSAAHYRQIKCAGVIEVLARPRAADARVDIRVAITFADARGTRWTREASGQLSKVTATWEWAVPSPLVPAEDPART